MSVKILNLGSQVHLLTELGLLKDFLGLAMWQRCQCSSTTIKTVNVILDKISSPYLPKIVIGISCLIG